MRTAVSIVLLLIAISIAVANLGAFDVLSAARGLSLDALLFVFAALLLNGLAAALRLKVISHDIARPIGYAQALAAVSAGSLAGVVFFQIAGQLIARGAIMARGGIDFSSVVVMTAYERAVAAILSLLLAIGGAYFIFGRIYLDQGAGGGDLVKIFLGLLLAGAGSALYAYGREALKALPAGRSAFVVRFLRTIGLSAIVQAPMMAAYVVAAHTLAPSTNLADLIAASAIVMFAASIPISLAGWGVREMSAIVALGAVGIATGKALVAAIVIGVGSILAMSLLALVSMRFWTSRPAAKPPAPHVDYTSILFWAVPIATATLVLFQLYLPISSSTLLNVNLADPFAILGGALFVIAVIRNRKPPTWRFSYLNQAILAATTVMTISLLIGISRFGFTEWAWINRYLGWFILLSFAATGALLVRHAHEMGLVVLLRTYAAATAAIVALEIVLVVLREFGLALSVPIVTHGVLGFSQNHNFFGFQILMALCAAAVAAEKYRTPILAILIAGIWFTGSRSSWIALPCLMIAAVYMRAITARQIGLSVFCAIAIILVTLLPALLTGEMQRSIILLPSPESHSERLMTILGGLELFRENPLFGSGLGAFRNKLLISSMGQPLLIHSTPVWLLAETGIVGFLVFLLPALAVLTSESRGKDLGAKLLVPCLIAFAVMAMPADMLYQRTFWLLIGAGLALTENKRAPTAPLKASG